MVGCKSCVKDHEKRRHLGSFTTEAASKLDVLGLDGDTLGVDGAKIGVFKEGNKIGLDGLLQSTDGGRLEAKVGFEVLSNLTNQALEGQLPDEELGGLLVATDFSECDGTLVRRSATRSKHADFVIWPYQAYICEAS